MRDQLYRAVGAAVPDRRPGHEGEVTIKAVPVELDDIAVDVPTVKGTKQMTVGELRRKWMMSGGLDDE